MPASIQQRLSELSWSSSKTFSLDGVEFVLEDIGAGDKSGAYRVMKPRYYLDSYAEVLGSAPSGNVLELGILNGGSAVLFYLLLQPDKLVSLDICEPVPALEAFRADPARRGRISTYYRTSQDDEATLTRVVDSEFAGDLDIVLDDASHFYEQTRRSFEILFPRLRPFGWYVIEDWHWAHVPPVDFWPDKPALSNLIQQLTIICGGRRKLISKIEIRGGVAFIQKGEIAASRTTLDVDKLCWRGNREFKLL